MKLSRAEALLQKLAASVFDEKVRQARRELNAVYDVILGDHGITNTDGTFREVDGEVIFEPKKLEVVGD